MLVESLVKSTLELQGFRVISVTGDRSGLVVELTPDLRLSLHCVRCGERGCYRDTLAARHFRHVPLWGDPGDAGLRTAAGEL